MKTIFIGPLGGGCTPKNGASIKNYHIINSIKPLLKDLVIIDTEKWKKSPTVLLRLIGTVILNREARYILSTSFGSANTFIRALHRLCPKAIVVYWVIGGYVDKLILRGEISPESYKHLHQIIVEGASMKRNLNKCGLNNVVVMPNFKPIVEVPIVPRTAPAPLKFVFLSRIIPDKGVELIIEAVSRLNQMEGVGFEVSFYGPMDKEYEQRFMSLISPLSNVSYCGFLDLRQKENYRVLTQYDVMLFPTYWKTEGCPGVVIDAFMCGLAVVASDWNLNADYISNRQTGLIIPPKDSSALADAMLECIQNPALVQAMQENSKKEVQKYAISNVLSRENLSRLGII
jgi:glycosyltransferase involved in cell wall biosynthesis